MEGFVPRQSGRRVGGSIGGEKNPRELTPSRPVAADKAPRPTQSSVSRAEIDASLRGIEEEESQELANLERTRRRKQPSVKKPKWRKWLKRLALLLLVVVICIGGYVGFKAIIASGNVFKGSLLGLLQNQPLKQDVNGRSNVLILGTSEDDPGHQGANLTDSMMVLSIDQNKKNAYMISIPRDLYVKYDRACTSGYEGKINVYYSCVHNGEGVEADRKALGVSEKFIGNILGLDIQYGVNVNYTVMRELVKAVGGTITVNIEGNGPVPAGVKPGSVMDSNFDWKCGAGDWKVSYAQRLKRCPPRGHFIDYGPGPQKLDAEHALYLAQARGDSSPTWGLAQSNFDREKNQQKILKALRDKAASAGVLSDFGKVSAIADALGNNLRTTFETKEVRTLVSLAKDIQDNAIQSISLIDGDDPVMATGNVNGQSVVIPAAGTYDYSQLRSYLQQKLSPDPVVREAAPIAVLNASGVAGEAQTEADKLQADKYTIADVGNAPSGHYARYTLYRIGSGDDNTAAKLEQRYQIKLSTGTAPVSVDSTVKFVLIVGPQPTPTSN